MYPQFVRQAVLLALVSAPLTLAVGCGTNPTQTSAAAQSAAAPSAADETPIRALYQKMLDSWPDPMTYAANYAPDVDYIIADGTFEHGRQDIINCHKTIFATWARDSRLAGHINRIRFLTPDVAVITAYGHIVLPDSRPGGERDTIYTLTAQRTNGGWTFVAYENTPLERQ